MKMVRLFIYLLLFALGSSNCAFEKSAKLKTIFQLPTSTPTQSVGLLQLSVSSGTLSPAFSQEATSYTLTVINSITSIDITPVTTESTNIIFINGVQISSNSSQAINLTVGANTITIEVKGQDGTIKTYTIIVTRATSNSYTVGGTISGLSGTVVLQDNGSDNLTLSSNGTFTFATSVIDGGVYLVTVLTNPVSPLQVCSVANGSGQISSSNVTSITITCNSESIAYSSSPFTFNQNIAITAINPTLVGTPTSCSSSPSLPAGLSLSSTCDISGTPTTTQGATSYTITAVTSSGNVTATISITIINTPSKLTYSSSSYTFTQSIAITVQDPTFTGTITACDSSPTLPTGLSLSNTCSISGTPTTIQGATSYTITPSNSSGSGSTATISITINYAAPNALSYSGSPYTFSRNAAIITQTATVTGTITSCTSSPTLPSGLSINNTTCAISGTPTTDQGATGYTITASNNGGSATTSINISINSNPPSALSYAGSPYTFSKNSAISTITPTYSGTITGCSSNPVLPTGLAISSTNCAISGTPTANTGGASYTITASNAFGNTTATINITVNSNAPASLTYLASPYYLTQNVTITTIVPAYTGSIASCSSSPALPVGLSLSSSCSISGAPSVTQAATSYTITATNLYGNTTATLNITSVNFLYSASSFEFKQNSVINTLNPTGSGIITACSSTPTLPTGLSLSSTCVISGTPTTVSIATNYIITPTMTGYSSVSTTIRIEVSVLLYKIFVTNRAYTGDLKTNGAGVNGIVGADNLCNSDTNKPADGSTYKAMITDGSVRVACTSSDCINATAMAPENVNWVMKPTSNYIRASDSAVLFTTNAAGIFLSTATITNSFDSGTQKKYWTGFSSATKWDVGSVHCNLWTSGLATVSGRSGLSDSKAYSQALRDLISTPTCDNSYYLLCVEQ